MKGSGQDSVIGGPGLSFGKPFLRKRTRPIPPRMRSGRRVRRRSFWVRVDMDRVSITETGECCWIDLRRIACIISRYKLIKTSLLESRSRSWELNTPRKSTVKIGLSVSATER